LNIKHVILILLFTKLTIPGLHSQTREVRLAQKEAEKTEQLRKKYYQKARKFFARESRKNQDKNTQKKMAEARKRAHEFNKRKKDIFLIRFIKKRKAKQ
jgi:hypothetical protein